MASFSASYDGPLLLPLADYKLLESDQLAVLCNRNVAATRRRLAILRDKGLVRISASGLHGGRGRPEHLVSLTESGAQCLKALGLIDAATPTDQLTAVSVKYVRHEQLVNEVRVQLALLDRCLEGFSVIYHVPNRTPQPSTVPDAAGADTSAQDASRDDQGLIPDGVFALTHAGTGKALLFFLEADRGTESLGSDRAGNHDVRSKIRRYQALLGDGGYRRYERNLRGGPFKGFRVLFVADGLARLAGLNRLITNTPPSDFCWATDAVRMRSQGIWAAIWTAGGDVANPCHSILGSLAPERPPSPMELKGRRTTLADQGAAPPPI